MLFMLTACKEQVMDTEKLLALPVDMTKSDSQQVIEAEGICGGPLSQEGEIRLKWTADKERLKKQRIDLSVHKNGLAEGRYTTMFPNNEKAGFKPAKLTDPKFNGSVEVLPALEKLKIKSLGRETAVGDAKTGSGDGRLMVVVTDFEPGLNYFIRVLTLENDKWVPGPVVRVEAPVCPKDEFLGD